MALKKCKCETSPSPWELVKVKKSKNEVIRIGDYVEIIKPEIFIRVGYNLTTQDILDNHITTEQRQLLNALIVSTGFNTDTKGYFLEGKSKDISELEKTFARLILRAKGWGGRERKVHTKLDPNLLNTVGKVISKKYVKTGLYNHATSHQGYFDDYAEYEPAYLENEKTVIIYEIAVNNNTYWAEYIEFPESSVVKISNEDYNEIIEKTPTPSFW